MSEPRASEPQGCGAVETVAPDLALGLLAGAERSATLAHVERCVRCRALVAELSGAVDSLLELAPGAEPPEGFECRVLGAIAGAATNTSRRDAPAGRRVRSRSRIAVATAGATVLAAVLAGLGILAAGSFDDGPSSHEEIMAVTMRTPGGREVGEAYLGHADPSWIFVSVPNWRTWEDDDDSASNGGAFGAPSRQEARQEGSGYRLRLALADGGEETWEIASLVNGDGSWGTTVGVDLDEVLTVAVVGEDGRVWCEASLPQS